MKVEAVNVAVAVAAFYSYMEFAHHAKDEPIRQDIHMYGMGV